MARRVSTRALTGSTAFNGTSSSITTPVSIGSANAITLVAWVKSPTPTANQAIISRPSGSSDTLEVNGSGVLRWRANLSTSPFDIGSTYKFLPNAWTHVTATYDSATGQAAVYVNGTSIATATGVGTFLNAGAWNIGALSTARYWRGNIADVRIFSTALTATAIANLYFDDISQTTPIVQYLLNDAPSLYVDRIGGQTATGSNTTLVTDTSYKARTTITTPRAIATQRVAVRDMGTALRFVSSAATNQVTITHNSNYTFGRNVSVSMWFTPSTLQNDAALVSKGIGSATPIDIRYINLNGNVVTYAYDGTFQPSANTPAGMRLVPGRKYHITSTTDTNTIKLYINGVLVSSGTNTTVGTTDNATNITVGNRTGGGAQWLNGIMDSVRIYNTTLTAAEIANMYFNNIVPRNGLVAEYLFNEATGSTALDTSGNGNHGTITGATYTTDVPLKLRTII